MWRPFFEKRLLDVVYGIVCACERFCIYIIYVCACVCACMCWWRDSNMTWRNFQRNKRSRSVRAKQWATVARAVASFLSSFWWYQTMTNGDAQQRILAHSPPAAYSLWLFFFPREPGAIYCNFGAPSSSRLGVFISKSWLHFRQRKCSQYVGCVTKWLYIYYYTKG